jgi:NADP-dependent 3-hydroxy acid dehydrogenase YdfG
MSKSILITGAASGIGQSTAKLFHRKGWRVGLIDINQTSLLELTESLGKERTWSRALDVRDSQAVDQCLSDFTQHGAINVLFNCAGILSIGSFEDIDLQRHHDIFDVNIKGLVNFCYMALPYLKQAKEPVVINVSSASAVYGIPYLATYSSSKFAVRGITEALNLEWQKYGIRVCDVMPPFVDTPMVRDQSIQAPSLKRLGVNLSSDDIANVVWLSAKSTHFNRVHYPVSLFFKGSRMLLDISPNTVSRQIMKWIGT